MAIAAINHKKSFKHLLQIEFLKLTNKKYPKNGFRETSKRSLRTPKMAEEIAESWNGPSVVTMALLWVGELGVLGSRVMVMNTPFYSTSNSDSKGTTIRFGLNSYDGSE